MISLSKIELSQDTYIIDETFRGDFNLTLYQKDQIYNNLDINHSYICNTGFEHMLFQSQFDGLMFNQLYKNFSSFDMSLEKSVLLKYIELSGLNINTLITFLRNRTDISLEHIISSMYNMLTQVTYVDGDYIPVAYLKSGEVIDYVNGTYKSPHYGMECFYYWKNKGNMSLLWDYMRHKYGIFNHAYSGNLSNIYFLLNKGYNPTSRDFDREKIKELLNNYPISSGNFSERSKGLEIDGIEKLET